MIEIQYANFVSNGREGSEMHRGTTRSGRKRTELIFSLSNTEQDYPPPCKISSWIVLETDPLDQGKFCFNAGMSWLHNLPEI